MIRDEKTVHDLLAPSMEAMYREGRQIHHDAQVNADNQDKWQRLWDELREVKEELKALKGWP